MILPSRKALVWRSAHRRSRQTPGLPPPVPLAACCVLVRVFPSARDLGPRERRERLPARLLNSLRLSTPVRGLARPLQGSLLVVSPCLGALAERQSPRLLRFASLLQEPIMPYIEVVPRS